MNVGPVLQISYIFVSSQLKNPYTIRELRVGDGVPGAVAVLFSPAEEAGLA